MSEPAQKIEIIRGHCPTCGGERNSFVRGKYQKDWRDDEVPINGSITHFILECCGCEAIYIKRDEFFSENMSFHHHPVTGEQIYDPGIETTYWPSPIKREEPEWIRDIHVADTTLGKLLTELYSALNNDIPVLAAIGARTAFDRASELLGVDAALSFDKKLDRLVELEKVSKEERGTLNVLVDAGSAAAHRAWVPGPKELATMMAIVEAFLHRAFILGDGIKKLKAAVPPKPPRPKKAPGKKKVGP